MFVRKALKGTSGMSARICREWAAAAVAWLLGATIDCKERDTELLPGVLSFRGSPFAVQLAVHSFFRILAFFESGPRSEDGVTGKADASRAGTARARDIESEAGDPPWFHMSAALRREGSEPDEISFRE